MIFSHALRETLHQLLATDPRVVLLGEDIADPYGGAFKVTAGLSTAFPDRVRTTPVSEAAITGISTGLALAGYRPIVEIMFGDFLALCFDQIINHVSKYQAMYHGNATCPVILRTPSGAGKGYGPTHSQSLEKHFLGIPHLKVAAASLYHDPLEIFRNFLLKESPILYIEHKLLYPMQMSLPNEGKIGMLLSRTFASEGFLPTLSISPLPRGECTTTIVSYGYQAVVVEKIIQKLAVEEEIFAELLVPSQLSPVDYDPIIQSVTQTGSLVTIEEGTAGWAYGTEIASVVYQRRFKNLRHPIEILTSQATVIPSAKHLERQMLVQENVIEETLRKVAL